MIFSTIVCAVFTLALLILLIAKREKGKKGWTFICFGVGAIFIGQLFTSFSLLFPELNSSILFDWIVTNATSLMAFFAAIGLSFIGVGIFRINFKNCADQVHVSELENQNFEL
ncbi:MAG: hypothetical protein PF541_07960 [Prolixibacteraceae bacterium]|jgi:O-antigen ligase|nr:hypothetical protein [Prolixibacteraceae bacterium]